MKADLYVQGNFWATIELPGDSLLALLATGMIMEATRKGHQLAKELKDLAQVQCSVNLRFRHPPDHTPPQGD